MHLCFIKAKNTQRKTPFKTKHE